MGFEFIGGEAAPNTKLLPSSDGVIPAGGQQWTICTKGFSGLDGLFSNFPVWQVLGKENVGQPLAGHFSDSFDGEEELTVGVSVVKHIVSLGG